MLRKSTLVLMILAIVAAAAGCGKKVDIEAERAALRATDAQWSNASGNVESFMSFFAPDGTLMPPNEPAVSGAASVRDWASRMMATPGFSLTWQANSADVSSSGDMGYTTGTYEFRMNDPYGGTIADHGKYLTVWRKDAEGDWKVVADQFNSDVPMETGSAPVDSTWTDDK